MQTHIYSGGTVFGGDQRCRVENYHHAISSFRISYCKQ